MNPRFLSVEEVLKLHARQLARYGGGEGIRDQGLLESAVAQPCASFGGAWMHPTLTEMAGAYVFHIVSNHPFVDGNKRAGLLAALTFLWINGVTVRGQSERLYDLTMAIAQGIDKAQALLIWTEIIHAEITP